MTTTEARLEEETHIGSIRSSSYNNEVLEIAYRLDMEFESQIDKYSLKFKNTSSENHYIKYFEWNCERSCYPLIILILIIELINLIVEIFYLAFNNDKINTIMFLIFGLCKGTSILLEILSTFHHHNRIIFILCDFLIFLSLVVSNFGTLYINIIKDVDELDEADCFIATCISIQFFLALYARSKLFHITIIYFLISFSSWIFTENLDIFLHPGFGFIKLGGFIILAMVGTLFLYYVNKSNRRNFFFLNKIISDLKNQKNLIENIPIPLFISDQKDVLYINNPSINLFNLKENTSSLKIQELDNIKLEQKDKNENISLLNYLIENNVESNQISTLLKIKNEEKDLEATKIPIIYNNTNCLITCFRELSAILKRAKDQIQKKFELLIIGCITHNFRTPLNSILGISDLALTSSMSLSDLHKQYFHKINQQSLILFNLVDNIHEYFKFKNNKLEREDILFHPLEEINSILELLEDEIKGKNIKISIKLDDNLEDDLTDFVNDKKKYRLIIWSSISNSIMYTLNGVIEIKLAYNRVQNSLMTIIEDEGETRPKETFDNLFQDDSHNEFEEHLNHTSLGIKYGMSLSKAFSTVMGGNKFELKSKQDKGTILIFEIKNYYDQVLISPILDNSPSSNLNSARLSSRPLLQKDTSEILKRELEIASSRFKILIVDDVDSNLFIFTNYSEKIKVNYDLAHNGLEALQLFEKTMLPDAEYSYKLIFMDINMPIMDGIEATKKIRDVENKVIKTRSNVLIIGVTANMGSSIKSECLNAGMTKFHTKPFSFKDFKKCIELAFL